MLRSTLSQVEQEADMFIHKTNGLRAKLLEQHADHTVTFKDENGDGATVPAHQFFGAFREATPEEVATLGGFTEAEQEAIVEASADKAGVKEPAE